MAKSATKKDIVKISVLGEVEEMERGAAISFYTKGFLACDGSEKDRYDSVLFGLNEGLPECNDEWDYD